MATAKAMRAWFGVLCALAVAEEAPAPAPPGHSAPGETRGCFHYGYAYSGFLNGLTTHSDTVGDCQEKCKAHPGCTGFSWWTAPKYECDLRAPGTLLRPTTDESGAAISGPAVCPANPVACSELPGPFFPGRTPEESAAAWPGGEVPSHNQCWPRDSAGYSVDCEQQGITVLEDTEHGWPGKCEGLEKVDLPEGKTCEQSCRENIFCAVWQEMSVTNPPECWQGSVGLNCYKHRPGFKPGRSQRLMHGTYRVLKDLKGIQVMGLTNVFGAEVFHHPRQVGAPKCRLYCLANLGCDYWLYSDVSGCWIEDSTNERVAYPLTQAEVDFTDANQTDFAASIVAGEYIQHYCGGNAVSAGVAAAELATRVPITRAPTGAPTMEPSSPAVFVDDGDRETEDGSPRSRSPTTLASNDVDWPPLMLAAGGVAVILLGASCLCRASSRRSAKRRRQDDRRPIDPEVGDGAAATDDAAEASRGTPSAAQDGDQHEQQPLLKDEDRSTSGGEKKAKKKKSGSVR